jgi:hypothetical protein
MNMRQSFNVILVLAMLSGALSMTVAAAPAVDEKEWSTDQPAIVLEPELLTIEGCDGVPQEAEFEVTNLTGEVETFDLSYTVPGGHAYLSGPPTIYVPYSETVLLEVTFVPELCLPDATVVTGVIQIADPGHQYSDTATLELTIIPGSWAEIAAEMGGGRMDNVTASWDGRVWSITGWGSSDATNVRTYSPATGWNSVPFSAPPFGRNNAYSGCQVDQIVYMYGDASTVGFGGLWMYDMDANTWSQVTPGGVPPLHDGIWASAWAYDPEEELCYLTGGSNTPDSYGNLASVYVYDPVNNVWQDPLPEFTTKRNYHAAFVLDQGGKQLCVIGGARQAAMLSSTQCYDLAAGTWSAENAVLGSLPVTWWGMGYADKWHLDTNHQLWLTAGVADGAITDETLYYDVAGGSWLSGGTLPSGAVYRGSATTLNNELYHIGGATGDLDYVGWSDRHLQCLLCMQAGVLAGLVLDGETDGQPTCTPAVVHIEAAYDIPVGADGFYQTHLLSGTYEVSAAAPGYAPVGPLMAEVMQGETTWLDFSLARPVVEVYPEGFTSITVIISQEHTLPLAIHNPGHLPLDFAIGVDLGPDDIPWVWTSPVTGTVPVTGSTMVDVTFFCTELRDYEGTLELVNSDPCRHMVEIPLLIHCRTTVSVFLPLLAKSD